MSEWIGTLLGILALFVYACLIGFKALDLSKLGKSSDGSAQLSDNQIRKARQALRFDMIRLAVDCILLTAFCISDLFRAWFSLFPDTPPGICSGCICLITFTLAVSIFADWLSIRINCRVESRKLGSFSHFLCQQLVNLLRIEFALFLVWGVFVILEPSKVSVMIRMAAAAGVLFLLRVLLKLGRNHKTAKPDSDAR